MVYSLRQLPRGPLAWWHDAEAQLARDEHSAPVFAIPADAPHPANAQAFLDYIMEPQVAAGISNTMNTPIEILEMSFPVRVDRYEIVADTGGVGRHRGGCGVERVWRILGNSSQFSVCLERTKSAPFGLAGGKAGGAGRITVIGPDVNLTARIERLCRELDRELIMSETFANTLSRPMWEIGHFELRGFSKMQRLYELPPQENGKTA